MLGALDAKDEIYIYDVILVGPSGLAMIYLESLKVLPPLFFV